MLFSKSQSASSVGSSSFSKKVRDTKGQRSKIIPPFSQIAHLDRKERQFAGGAAEVKKDARHIDAMSRNVRDQRSKAIIWFARYSSPISAE